MWNTKLQAIVLAAGHAKRLRTGRTKLLEKICGREMILYTTKMLEGMDIETTVVVGHQKDDIEKVLKEQHETIEFAHQEQQLGTGHAIASSSSHWKKENILVLNGDMPLITPQIIEQLYSAHCENDATISFVISHLDHPDHGYGRVIQSGDSVKIVEAKDFKGNPCNHCWINAGIYLINKKFLEKNIHLIDKSNASKEFYLTDLIGMASQQGHKVITVPEPFDRVRGVNTMEELWTAEQIKRSDLIRYWMTQGVRFIKAQNVHVHIDVTIGSGSQIGGGVYLERGTTIGKNCTVREYTRLENAQIGENTTIKSHCVITDSTIGNNAEIGPFAHVRNETIIAPNASIGNFVEVKKSFVGQESKARHLSYIGDATVGKNVNIGAGTITCNYDGAKKNETVIEDNAQIGSNNTLIAPLTIQKNAYTAAGSTITDDVPKNALALGRAKQVNKADYVPKLVKKLKRGTKTKEKKETKTRARTTKTKPKTEKSI